MLRNVYFVMERLEIEDLFQRFSVFLKLENYEFVEMGDFVKSELPKGLNFPVLLDQNWFEKPEFEVEIRMSGGRKFVGILGINHEKTGGNSKFPAKLTSSGVATLFNLKNEQEQLEMQCTIVVEEPVARESVETRETQTDTRKRRETGNQTEPPPEVVIARSDASTMTSARHLSLDDMQPLLTATIARHLAEHQRKSSRRAVATAPEPPAPEDVEDPKPSKQEPADPAGARGGAPEDVLNSYNLMPRLTKLRDLDALIAEKSRILRELEMEIELKRKMNEVKNRREMLKNQQKTSESKNPLPVSLQSPKSAPQNQKSSSSSSSSEASTSSPSSESSESESTSSSSSSESSESSEVSPAPETPKIVKKNEEEKSTIDDPFSARKSPTLSPTSEYLKNLRAKMIEQYTQKYN